MRRNGEYETARNGWVGDYDDPSNMIELLYSTNGNNDGKYNGVLLGTYSQSYTVIGNIHDNPELLKGGADNG
jgi:ABC-type oligopeptide transport system substrate-binding subunit